MTTRRRLSLAGLLLLLTGRAAAALVSLPPSLRLVARARTVAGASAADRKVALFQTRLAALPAAPAAGRAPAPADVSRALAAAKAVLAGVSDARIAAMSEAELANAGADIQDALEGRAPSRLKPAAPAIAGRTPELPEATLRSLENGGRPLWSAPPASEEAAEALAKVAGAKAVKKGLLFRVKRVPDTLRRKFADVPLDAAAPGAVVARRRPFLAETFFLGSMAWRKNYISYFVSRPLVWAESSRIVRERFAAAPGAAEAFERFRGRVDALFGDGNASKTRNLAREALLDAAQAPPEKVAAVFDAKLGPEETARIEAFRRHYAPLILESFREEVEALIASEQASYKTRGYNIAGVAITGSFLYGTPTPDSDLDVSILTVDGGTRDVPRFMEKLEALRVRNGWPDFTDWYKFRTITKADPELVAKTYAGAGFLLVTPRAEVREALGPLSGDALRGKVPESALHRAVYRAVSPLQNLAVRAALRLLSR